LAGDQRDCKGGASYEGGSGVQQVEAAALHVALGTGAGLGIDHGSALSADRASVRGVPGWIPSDAGIETQRNG
jgi:hypothetical protein